MFEHWHGLDFSVQLMGVLIASSAGGRKSIMTNRRRKSPEQIVRLLGQATRAREPFGRAQLSETSQDLT